ncbi:MAG: NADH:ubiquinone oxidoreductase subunit RnfE [Oscillospiraceae bacterium]|nr:NADH:ubiquinone oxidoreductase subunit RnfE [Oscillospiraceae bacterium]
MNNKPSGKISLDGLFRQNIVLMSGLVTAPIVVAATSFERALVLTLSFLMISYSSILICRFIPRRIVYTVRIIIYVAVAAAMYIPTALLLNALFPETASAVSIYIEIIVVNSLILAKTESRFYLMPYGEMAVDALIYVLGYAMAAFAVGIIREFLAFGSLFGLRICDAPMPAAKTPFFGFLLLGILAAVCRAITTRRRTRSENSDIIRKGAE